MSKPRARRPVRRVRGPHLYERGGVWYAYLGARDRVSLETRDRGEAERRFAERLARAAPDVRRAARASEVPLVDLATQYLDAPHGWTSQTLRTARSRVEMVGAWFEERGVRLASEITPALVDAHVTARRTEVTHRTINRDLRAWRRMLAWGADRALVRPCPAVAEREDLREARRTERRTLPSPEEVARVLLELQARDEQTGARKGQRGGGTGPRSRGAALAVRALYATGLRIDELRRLTVGDLHDGAVWVRPEQGAASEAEPGKSHRERSIRLGDEGLAAVRAYLAWTEGRARVFSESWLVRRVARACARASVERFGLHDLRRAFATEAHRAGIPVLVISRWLGHADVRTTELYLGAYRSDRALVAPTPRGLTVAVPEGTVHSLCTTRVHESPRESISSSDAPGGESETASEFAGRCGSHPSGLNRRPAVYETANGEEKSKSNREASAGAVHSVSTRRGRR